MDVMQGSDMQPRLVRQMAPAGVGLVRNAVMAHICRPAITQIHLVGVVPMITYHGMLRLIGVIRYIQAATEHRIMIAIYGQITIISGQGLFMQITAGVHGMGVLIHVITLGIIMNIGPVIRDII
jgi:hypothetical protein